MDFGTLGSQGHVDLLGRERTEHRPVFLPSVCGGLFVTPPWGSVSKSPTCKSILAKRQGPWGSDALPIPPRGHVSFLCSQRLSSFGKLNKKTRQTNKKKKQERGIEKEGRVLGKVVLAYDSQEGLHRDQQADSVNNGVQWPLGLAQAPLPPAVFTPFFTPLAPQH